MKNSIMGLVGAVVLGLSAAGCKTVPTAETLYQCSLTIGVASGMVANQCKIGDEARNGVIEVMGVVREVVPETNETFAAAWTPIAQAHTQKLIDEGKIDAAAGVAIMAAFNAAVVGIDYVLYRYPVAKQYKDLTCAAVDGFCDGFLVVFRPPNDASDANQKDIPEYDEDAYMFIKERVSK